MNEFLTILSALSMMLMPITPANEGAVASADMIAPPAREVTVSAQSYMQGILFELPKDGGESYSTEAAVMEDTIPVSQDPDPQEELNQNPPEPEPEPEPKMSLLGTYRLTAYCPCKKCCGKSPSHPAYGITASGAVAEEGVTVAMAKLPFGTKVYIEGIGERIVQDRGGKVAKNQIDVFASTHERCYNPLYNRSAEVWIIEEE